MSILKRVALVGAGGHVGKFITQELLKTELHEITALTRHAGSYEAPLGVKKVYVDYNNKDSLVTALKDKDILVITLSVLAPQDTQLKLFEAAKEAGVKWIIPNSWGSDPTNRSLIVEQGLAPVHDVAVAQLTDLGLNYIWVTCGFWYEHSLVPFTWSFGFDYNDKSVNLYEDGNHKQTVSTWPQVGRFTAKLLSLPLSELESNHRNKIVFCGSFTLTQREMLESLERVTNSKWTINEASSSKTWREANEKVSRGDFSGFGPRLYSRIFFPETKSEFSGKLLNNRLGVPLNEDLDTATKDSIDLAESGYAYGT